MLKLSSYAYGDSTVHVDFRELEKHDGIGERQARRINRELDDANMVQVLRTRPRAYLLLSPESWKIPSRFIFQIASRRPSFSMREEDLGEVFDRQNRKADAEVQARQTMRELRRRVLSTENQRSKKNHPHREKEQDCTPNSYTNADDDEIFSI